MAACSRPIAARSRLVAAVAAPGGRNGTPSTSPGFGPTPSSTRSSTPAATRRVVRSDPFLSELTTWHVAESDRDGGVEEVVGSGVSRVGR